MVRTYLWPTVLIVSTVLVLISQKIIIPVVSPLLMAWFFFVCPGLALVGLLPVKQAGLQVGLTFALSIAINTLLAEIMAFAHLWSPHLALSVLVCLTITGIIFQFLYIALAAKVNNKQAEEEKPLPRQAIPERVEEQQLHRFASTPLYECTQGTYRTKAAACLTKASAIRSRWGSTMERVVISARVK